MKNYVIHFGPGLLTGLLSGWLLDKWSAVPVTWRVVISIVVAMLTVAAMYIIPREQRGDSKHLGVVSRLRARKNIQINDVDVKGPIEGRTEIVHDVKSKRGDVTISNINIESKDG